MEPNGRVIYWVIKICVKLKEIQPSLNTSNNVCKILAEITRLKYTNA